MELDSDHTYSSLTFVSGFFLYILVFGHMNTLSFYAHIKLSFHILSYASFHIY